MSKAYLLFAAMMVATGSGPVTAQAATPLPTRDFVNAAAQSDAYEIMAGRVALIESKDRGVRSFAQQMIDDHTRTSNALRRAANSAGVAPPLPGLGADQQKSLSALQSVRDGDFDKAYARQQVLAHEQALVVEQGYATRGTEPAIRQVAQSAVPMIQHHLATARQLRATVAGS
ncbi:MAG: DUF4142 domain-containing protein [Janthinobacterium lividum]